MLRKRARKVRSVGKKLLKLAFDMVDTMDNAGGVGLAANQVGQLQRLIVIRVPGEEEARSAGRYPPLRPDRTGPGQGPIGILMIFF